MLMVIVVELHRVRGQGNGPTTVPTPLLLGLLVPEILTTHLQEGKICCVMKRSIHIITTTTTITTTITTTGTTSGTITTTTTTTTTTTAAAFSATTTYLEEFLAGFGTITIIAEGGSI